MKILFIVIIGLFVVLNFYKYKCTSFTKFINFYDEKILRLEVIKRDIEEVSHKYCNAIFILGYLISLVFNLAVVYLAILGVETL